MSGSIVKRFGWPLVTKKALYYAIHLPFSNKGPTQVTTQPISISVFQMGWTHSATKHQSRPLPALFAQRPTQRGSDSQVMVLAVLGVLSAASPEPLCLCSEVLTHRENSTPYECVSVCVGSRGCVYVHMCVCVCVDKSYLTFLGSGRNQD